MRTVALELGDEDAQLRDRLRQADDLLVLPPCICETAPVTYSWPGSTSLSKPAQARQRRPHGTSHCHNQRKFKRHQTTCHVCKPSLSVGLSIQVPGHMMKP